MTDTNAARDEGISDKDFGHALWLESGLPYDCHKEDVWTKVAALARAYWFNSHPDPDPAAAQKWREARTRLQTARETWGRAWTGYTEEAAAMSDAIKELLALPLPTGDFAPRNSRPMSEAPKHRWIGVYCPPAHGLPAMVAHCKWHPDAGFCVDELREPSMWWDIPSPPAPIDETDSEAFILWYADQDVPYELFSDYGATNAAHARFEQQRSAWTCSLFKMIRRSPPDRETFASFPAPKCEADGMTDRELGTRAFNIINNHSSVLEIAKELRALFARPAGEAATLAENATVGTCAKIAQVAEPPPPAQPERRVVQIAIENYRIAALCSDGTIWTWRHMDNDGWSLMPPIPGAGT